MHRQSVTGIFLLKHQTMHVEGHHFDREQAGEPDPQGSISSSRLKGLFEKVEKTISAFCNADGGLLICTKNCSNFRC
jgi:hypothetical protein